MNDLPQVFYIFMSWSTLAVKHTPQSAGIPQTLLERTLSERLNKLKTLA